MTGESATRIAVDVRRFPWIRRLAADYAYDFRAVAPFFSGDPADREAWAHAIARTQAHKRRRQETVLLPPGLMGRGADASRCWWGGFYL